MNSISSYKSNLKNVHVPIGNSGSTVVKVLCYKSEGRWFDPSWWSLEYFVDKKSFRSHYGPGGRLSL